MKFKDMPYERIDFEKANKQLLDLTEELINASSASEAIEIHKKHYDLMRDFETMYNLAYIRHSCDTADEFYDAENNFYDEKLPEFEEYINKYEKALYNSPFRKELEDFIGPVAFKNMELSMKCFDEKIIPLLQEENALSSKYSKLIASAKIDFRGETYNLSLLAPFLTAEDRDTRKEAYAAYDSYFASVTDEIDEIYDQMVKVRTKIAHELGFENYVDMAYCRMGRNCYGKAEVENLRKQIKESFIPFVSRLHESRRVRLGVDSLHMYDNGVFFKEGNPAPIVNDLELLKMGQKMYGELSPKTKEFMDFMMENELIDYEGRKTKQAGGYMTFIPNYKAPFIFANFNKTHDDVGVVTHECGHAFQGYVTKDEQITEKNAIGMETAEIHSMSMEYFTYKWYELFFGDKADTYRTLHFEDSLMFLPYGCMVDEFQHIVYANPEMSKSDRKDVWKKLEAEYRPHINFEGTPFFANGGFWQKQGHIFASPFYYIDYVIASTCAMQFKVRMDENFDEAFEDYVKLCELSASDFFVNMLPQVGLKVPFEDGCIAELVEKMETKL